MIVKVLSRVGQFFSRTVGGLSLAQDSMLLRLRRASLALLGFIGVVGLSLLVFISQLDWTGVLTNPLPSGPAKVGKIHDAVALTHPARPRHAATNKKDRVTAAGVAHRKKQRTAPRSDQSQRHGSHKVGSSSPASPKADVGAPPSPAPSSPPSEPAPVVTTPPPSSPTTVSAEGGPTTTAASKAANDSGRAAGLAAAKSPGPLSAASKDSASSTSKSTEMATAKSHRDEGSATPAAPIGSPPAAASPAAAKEAADAARASQAGH